jgi:hypothetical protein
MEPDQMPPCEGNLVDEKRKAEDRLQKLLLDGLNSPEAELKPEDWADIRRQAIEKMRKSARSD